MTHPETSASAGCKCCGVLQATSKSCGRIQRRQKRCWSGGGRRSAILLSVVTGLMRASGAAGYRVMNLTTGQVSVQAFATYETGFVRDYGDPVIYTRERVNEGAAATEDQPRIWEGVSPRQLCPNMVGPLNGVYYCRGKEYGYCDQRSGVCFCNMGYAGLGCDECSPTHYESGSLCYPKKLCPSDCSGAGACDYITGTCRCKPHRAGADCSQEVCTRFHKLCTYCTNTTCLRCLEGYSVDSTTSMCHACTRFDPRCTSCDESSCLACGDPLLLSTRRSARRLHDPLLPFDEQSRQLSGFFPFGTQRAEFFDEAEVFSVVVDAGDAPLNRTSRACAQGIRGDDMWNCTAVKESHTVCGHKGTISFASPEYLAREGRDDTIRITVVRTGGGYGNVHVNYTLVHLNTTPSDVTPTAHYTASQALNFQPGVVKISFLITIHDNSDYEADRRFALHLSDPTDGAVLGPQSTAVITIADDDANKTSPIFSHPAATGLDLVGTAGVANNFTITAVSTQNITQVTGGDFFMVSVENVDDQELMDVRYNRLHVVDGSCRSIGNGSYPCTWTVDRSGDFLLRAFQLVPHGLVGEYYEDVHFSELAFSRVHRVVNFTWGIDRLTEHANDFVSIRWQGRVRANYTERYLFTASADDHVRLWIDHELIIDQWDRPLGFSHGAANLTARRFHHILLEYREMRGRAHMQLWWSSLSTPFQIIPKVNLFRQYEISGSPVRVHVNSADTDAASSYCEGQGVVKGIAGEVQQFRIYPVDKFGNARDDSDVDEMAQEAQQFSAVATLVDNRGHGWGSTSVTASVSYDQTLTAFVAEYVPTISGIYSLTVAYQTWRNQTLVGVRGSPFTVTIDEARTFAATCKVLGAGLFSGLAGVSQNFTIHAKDAYGNQRHVGGDAFDVIAYHSSGDHVDIGSIKDVGNGTYHMSLIPLKKGNYRLFVLLKSPSLHPSSPYSLDVTSHVVSSPYKLWVRHNLAYGPTSTASGGGLTHAIVGYQASFVVTCYDRWSNRIDDNLYNVTVVAAAARPVYGTVVAYGNGTSLVLYTPRSAGVNLLSVKVRGLHIRGSPFRVGVLDGDNKANTSIASGESLFSAEAGTLASFIIQAHDPYNNTRTRQANPSRNHTHLPVWNLTMTGPSTVTNSSVYLSAGRHVLSYNATVAGVYNLTVVDALTGQHIVGSPFHPYVRPAPGDASRTVMSGAGVSHGTAGLQQPTIHSVDRFGNLLDRGGDLYIVTLMGPSNCSEPCRHSLAPSPTQSLPPAGRLIPDIGTSANGFLASTSELYNGSEAHKPLDGVDVDRRAEAVPVSVTDQLDGTYTLEYNASQAGQYLLRVALGVSGQVWATYYRQPGYRTPYQGQLQSGLNITWGADGPVQAYKHSNTTVKTHEAFSATFRSFLRVPASGEYTFYVNMDTHSQCVVRLGGVDVVEASDQSVTTSTHSFFLTQGSIHTLEVRYQHLSPAAADEAPRVSLEWSTPPQRRSIVPSSALYLFYDVANTVYRPLIVPDVLHPPASTASGQALTQAVAGYTASFTLYARDKLGNILLNGGDRAITVIGRGQHASALFLGTVAEDFGNGTYLITYTATAAGVYTLTVAIGSTAGTTDLGYHLVDASISGAQISGRRFTLTVSPGPVCAPTSYVTGDGTVRTEAGSVAHLTLHPRDCHGNAIETSVKPLLSAFTLWLEPLTPGAATAHASPAAHVNGTWGYVAASNVLAGGYNVTRAGTYRLRVQYVGEDVAGSTSSIKVVPGRAYGPRCTHTVNGSPRRNVSNTFVVGLADAFGNRLTTGGDQLFVKIAGPEVIYPSVVDEGNGFFVVSYMPAFRGIHNVTLELAMRGIDAAGGLAGAYYNQRRMQGTPALVRQDEKLGGDCTPFAKSDVGVRWTGFLKAPLNATFTFYTRLGGRDQARVFIAKHVVVSHDNAGGHTEEASGTMSLQSGRLYEVMVELEHGTGPCSLDLFWSSDRTPRQLVPPFYMFPASQVVADSPVTVVV